MTTGRLATLAIITLAANQAGADVPAAQAKLNKKLQGTYYQISSEACVSSLAGFGPAPQFAALGPTTTTTTSVEATIVFNGDGTVTTTNARALEIINPNATTPPSGSFPTLKADFTCSGTYQVNPDKSFTTAYGCSGVTTSGEVPGTSFTQSGVRASGRILGKLLLGSSLEGNVETISSIYGTAYRICRRSMTSRKAPAAAEAE